MERDDFCQRILKARMSDHCLPKAPIHGDVRTYKPEGEAKYADLVSAGFPCQARPAHWSARFAVSFQNISKSFDRLFLMFVPIFLKILICAGIVCGGQSERDGGSENVPASGNISDLGFASTCARSSGCWWLWQSFVIISYSEASPALGERQCDSIAIFRLPYCFQCLGEGPSLW